MDEEAELEQYSRVEFLRGGTHLNTKYEYFGECKWSPWATPVRRPLHQIRFVK